MNPPRKRRVVVLGSTGSIGESALKVARDIPERMEIVAIAANKNAERFAEQVREVQPLAAALTDSAAAAEARELLRCSNGPVGDRCSYGPMGRPAEDADPHVTSNEDGPQGRSYNDGLQGRSNDGSSGSTCEILEGADALCELATHPEADLVLIAIVGTAGLRPALAAIEAGKDIAVASKEILVMAGEAVMTAARRKGVKVLPVDSEHNAIFQCLEGHRADEVKRLILTASGGPFRTLPASELADVTLERALKHPTWTMGAKITIDSATLFNKGLEMIEARWLFDVEMARVDVIVHPQSVIHSMVEFIDGSVLAQLSVTDMCFPIQYAVTWPERVPNTLKPLDFATLSKLEFEPPRREDFPALDLARWAGEAGGTLPAVLNAANEVAVEAFLGRRCGFPAIWQTVERVMREHAQVAHPELDVILQADDWARHRAREVLPTA